MFFFGIKVWLKSHREKKKNNLNKAVNLDSMSMFPCEPSPTFTACYSDVSDFYGHLNHK